MKFKKQTFTYNLPIWFIEKLLGQSATKVKVAKYYEDVVVLTILILLFIFSAILNAITHNSGLVVFIITMLLLYKFSTFLIHIRDSGIEIQLCPMKLFRYPKRHNITEEWCLSLIPDDIKRKLTPEQWTELRVKIFRAITNYFKQLKSPLYAKEDELKKVIEETIQTYIKEV